MTITYYDELIQGSDPWLQARCGLLTASEMKHIITPRNLKPANNDKERTHLYELLAQRITNYVEPAYIGDHMLRGVADEVEARIKYEENFAEVKDMGFITNDKWGFIIGYSPDGLVGDDGLIECKSRLQKFQVRTIIDGVMPDDFLIQVQTGLLVSERSWCDFISYCGGLPFKPIRVFADEKVQNAIVDAAEAFERKMAVKLDEYMNALQLDPNRYVHTERRAPEEDIIITTNDEEGNV